MSFIAVKMSLKNIASQLECLAPGTLNYEQSERKPLWQPDLNSWEHRLDLCLEADQATEGYVVFHVPSDFRFVHPLDRGVDAAGAPRYYRSAGRREPKVRKVPKQLTPAAFSSYCKSYRHLDEFGS